MIQYDRICDLKGIGAGFRNMIKSIQRQDSRICFLNDVLDLEARKITALKPFPQRDLMGEDIALKPSTAAAKLERRGCDTRYLATIDVCFLAAHRFDHYLSKAKASAKRMRWEESGIRVQSGRINKIGASRRRP